MKQVIIVAPQFPPNNLAAVHRSRYFAMHLPKFGWKVKILSIEPSYYEGDLDHELEALLPSDLKIIRTKAFPVRPLRLIGDLGLRAFWWHYRALCRLSHQDKIDLVYIPIPPNYSAMLGPLINRKFGIPYAIDYMDPWVPERPWGVRLFSKAWLSHCLGGMLEPVVLRKASLITAVAPGYYEVALKRYPWVSRSLCIAMPCGAEQKDFRYLDEHPRYPYLFNQNDKKIHIVYTGVMWSHAHSTLEALCKALILIKKESPGVIARLKFDFIGTGHAFPGSKESIIKTLAHRYNVSNIISENAGRIPYLDALNHMRYAHAVLILGSTDPYYTPSKVFQAILSRRPILAILHAKSTAVDVLTRVRAGAVVTFDEEHPVETCVDEIARALRRIMAIGYSPTQIDWHAFDVYSAETMTRRLAEAFDRII